MWIIIFLMNFNVSCYLIWFFDLIFWFLVSLLIFVSININSSLAFNVWLYMEQHYINFFIISFNISSSIKVIFSIFQVYDLTSGQQIASFYDPNNANNYLKNVACFSPCDNFILNDGVLWDVRSHKLIHKFDKFNENISGTFHPAGHDVIINAEVVSFHFNFPKCNIP